MLGKKQLCLALNAFGFSFIFSSKCQVTKDGAKQMFACPLLEYFLFLDLIVLLLNNNMFGFFK